MSRRRGKGRVALVYRGDLEARRAGTVANTRLGPVADALAEVGLSAEPAVYGDDLAEEVRSQLLTVDGVLVWVDPVTDGEDRLLLDRILREVAAAGVWVSAHPDTIMKMGTKDVVYATRHLGWGTDTARYGSFDEFRSAFPAQLAGGRARVLKQYRGNGGIGVWKVQLADPAAHPGPDVTVVVQSARQRDGSAEEVPLSVFLARCRKYFAFADGQGRLIDQPFQSRITEGLIRCYLVQDRVVGFCRQYAPGRTPVERGSGATPEVPDNRVFGLPAAKTMFGADELAFQSLRSSMENDWVPALQDTVGLETASLPVLWDADFLFGPPTPDGGDTYILSEINTSAVAPFPPQAVPALAHAVHRALRA